MPPTKASAPVAVSAADRGRNSIGCGGAIFPVAIPNPPQNQQADASLLAAALDYAARGWSVFPLWPRSKEPACKHGFKNATTNPATIRRYWLAQPEFNIAVATGIVSGVWVLDTDGAVGAETLRDLEARHGPIPPTRCSLTSRGPHLWFLADGPIQSSAGRVGLGLDVRGDGGYVLVPPSVHPDGPVYAWINAAPPAVAPAWLVELTRPRPAPSISQRAIARRSVGLPGRLRQGRARARDRGSGQYPARAHAIMRSTARAFPCINWLPAASSTAPKSRQRLLEAATANGLMADPDDGPRAVMRTIASGARAGLAASPHTDRGAS